MWVPATTVCDHIGATEAELSDLVAEGLPHRTLPSGKREFNLAAVESWLLANDRVETAGEEIARTRAEAARRLGLGIAGERTIAKWLADPDFPGRSGTPGKRDGYFPIGQIQAWRAAKAVSSSPGGTVDPEIQLRRHRLMLLEIEEQERRLRQKLAGQLEASEVREFHLATVATARRVFGSLPGDIVRIIADSLAGSGDEQDTQTVLERARHLADTRTQDAIGELSLLLSGDDDTAGEDVED